MKKKIVAKTVEEIEMEGVEREIDNLMEGYDPADTEEKSDSEEEKEPEKDDSDTNDLDADLELATSNKPSKKNGTGSERFNEGDCIEINIDDILIPEKLLRDIPNKDNEKDIKKGITELANSIEKKGLLQRIVVSTKGVLVAGHRRLMACKELGRIKIEASIIRVEENDCYLIAGIENIHRKDMTLEEKGKYYKGLLESGKYHNSRKEVAKAAGVSPSTVTKGLKAINETKQSKCDERVDASKKAAKEKEAKPKFYKIDSQNLPENVLGFISKEVVSLHLKWKVNDKHLTTFDIQKEGIETMKKIIGKTFRAEAIILRKNA